MLNWLSLLTGILAGILALGLYLVGRRAKRESLAAKLKIEMLENNYQTLLQMYEKKSILVHDAKNHMRTIAKMVEDGKGEEVLAYITQMTGEMQQGSGVFYTNHRMLDSLLNMKYQEAAQQGIRVQCQYDDMRGMNLTLVEICALFTNLLDNAIEANLNCPAGTERRIEMVCRRHGKMLVVSIANPRWDVFYEKDSAKKGNNATGRGAAAERSEPIRTTKEDKDMHGFGMVSIQKVLESHGGYMKTDIQNHQFRIVVYLTAFKNG